MNKKLAVSLALALMCVSATSCYGPFKLTKKLHRWNGEVENKWAREGLFLVLVIVPVYPFAALGDAIIFNSIEFWSGENPIDNARNDSGEKKLSQGTVRVILSGSRQSGTLQLTAMDGDALIRTLRIVPGPRGTLLKDSRDRTLLACETSADGGVTLTNAGGEKLGTYSAEEADAFLARKF